MGIIQSIKRWWEALWQKEAQDKFGVETIESDVMKAAEMVAEAQAEQQKYESLFGEE